MPRPPALRGVPETMLMTLYHRALETRRPDRLFADEHAVRFVDRIDHDFARFDDWRLRWAIPVRTWLIDTAVRAFLERRPDGLVVTLGAGLDTRALRLDNGRATWFSVDLEPVRPFWQELIGDSDRNHLITSPVTASAWMERVQSEQDGRDILFVAEGLFQYLEEADVKAVVRDLRRRFPGSELVVEVLGDFMVGNTRLTPAVAGTGSVYRWGVNDAAALQTWADGITLLDQWFMADHRPERQGHLARLPGLVGGKGQLGKVARLRLGPPPG